MKLPVSRWVCLQVGIAKTPRSNAVTELTFDVPETAVQMRSGLRIDPFRNERFPLSMGSFKHNGLYINRFIPEANAWPVEELDLIQSYKGKYVPILFAKDYTSSTPCQDCCYTVPACWTYAWAYGKVRRVVNPFRTDDYTSPSAAEISIEGTLETPLQEITWARWRYGKDLTPTVQQNKQLMIEVERLQAEPKNQWYIPCEIPPVKSDNRFWPRDLNSPWRAADDLLFEYMHWDASEIVLMRPPTERLMLVWGNTAPRTQSMMRGDTRFTITTDVGTTEYHMEEDTQKWIYMDSQTGMALSMTLGGLVESYSGVCPIPQLDHFENHVKLTSGELIFGVTPQWVN